MEAMEAKELLKKVIQEMVLPELGAIRAENAEIKAVLDVTNRRLSDLQVQMTDLSRRIDETNKRIDETNKRIDQVRIELMERIESVRSELTEKIEGVRAELTEKIENVRSELTERHDRLDLRMDQLGKDIVRRNEHEQILRQYEHRITSVEKAVEEIKRRVAA